LERVPAPSVQARRPLSRRVAGALIAVALLAALTGTVALRSDRDALAAEVALREGRPEAALASARASVNGDGGRAARWDLLGRALEMNGRSSAASDAYAEAATRAPYRAAYWSDLARGRAKQLLSGDASGGGADAALAAAQRAVDADPNSPRPHAAFAEIANLTGAYEVALGSATRAIRLEPGRREYEDLAARAALSLGDPRAGTSALEELLPLHDSAPLRVALAKLSLQLGERDSARRHASRALELDPQNGDARAILSQTGG
jgi:tetratricopeptide (TPR) repeat protein